MALWGPLGNLATAWFAHKKKLSSSINVADTVWDICVYRYAVDQRRPQWPSEDKAHAFQIHSQLYTSLYKIQRTWMVVTLFGVFVNFSGSFEDNFFKKIQIDELHLSVVLCSWCKCTWHSLHSWVWNSRNTILKVIHVITSTEDKCYGFVYTYLIVTHPLQSCLQNSTIFHIHIRI